MSNNLTANLLHAIADNLSGLPSDWQSFSIVIGSFEGKLNSVGGYAYSPGGTITATAASTKVVLPALEEYLSDYYKPEEKQPVSVLIQLDRTNGKYKITFEDADENRWKVTPRNFKEIREDLRPVFDVDEGANNDQ